jgi:hypothetical protein
MQEWYYPECASAVCLAHVIPSTKRIVPTSNELRNHTAVLK